MTITLQLKPETEATLAEKAKQNNLKIEAFLENFIEERLEKDLDNFNDKAEVIVSNQLSYEERRSALYKIGTSHKNSGEPFLSDEALRRENIYEDRF